MVWERLRVNNGFVFPLNICCLSIISTAMKNRVFCLFWCFKLSAASATRFAYGLFCWSDMTSGVSVLLLTRVVHCFCFCLAPVFVLFRACFGFVRFLKLNQPLKVLLHFFYFTVVFCFYLLLFSIFFVCCYYFEFFLHSYQFFNSIKR